jgi:hypothetical protein
VDKLKPLHVSAGNQVVELMYGNEKNSEGDENNTTRGGSPRVPNWFLFEEQALLQKSLLVTSTFFSLMTSI